ncbi:YafY family protein [Luteimonas sp. TWI1437]|uniref:helix-turn-helix transcriptional regulator n=1 Tax=unclassified Luteimonas TaxID=2629088 RepID=UPI003208BDF2
MSERATRLLRLLDDLRRRLLPVPGRELADALGISLRTLYRDIEALRGQGAEIHGDPGVGYQLRPGFLLPAMMFSDEELEALVLGARWVGSHADPELADAATRALDRLVGVLPEALRLQVETSGLFAPHWAPSQPESWLPILRRAIRGERALRMHYADVAGRGSVRTIWPFAMAFLSETRLLAAWCEARGDFRHFRADRVVSLEDTGVRYAVRRHELLRRWHAQRRAVQHTAPAGGDTADSR